MDTTTTPFSYFYPEYDPDPEVYDYPLDRDPMTEKYQRARITRQVLLIGCMALAILLNLVVVGYVVAGVCVRKTVSTTARPRLLVMLASSVVLVVFHVFVPAASAVEVGCAGSVVRYLATSLLPTLVTLLLACVILMEAARIQRVVISVRSHDAGVQLALAAVLMLMSFVYCLVVVIPVFFFQALEDPAEPCRGGDYVDFVMNAFKPLFVVELVVPHGFVLAACAVLLVAHFTRARGSESPAYVHYRAPPTSPAPTKTVCQPNRSDDDVTVSTAITTSAATTTTTTTTTPPSLHHSATTSGSAQAEDPSSIRVVTSPPGQAEKTELPWHVLVAAIVSFAGALFTFVYVHMASDPDILIHPSAQVWAPLVGALLLQIRSIVLPCCWLADADVMTICPCCSCCRRGPPGLAPGVQLV